MVSLYSSVVSLCDSALNSVSHYDSRLCLLDFRVSLYDSPVGLGLFDSM
jgi:hypothetical protein